MTAHHLDSHDTFWWPEPGHKWRREQYGIPATAALMTVFCLSGGPYMTYVGGEVGSEDEVRAAAKLRWEHPPWAIGFELVGVLSVGTLSVIDPALLPRATVWSYYGAGYLLIPLVLPIVGLWWLRRSRPMP